MKWFFKYNKLRDGLLTFFKPWEGLRLKSLERKGVVCCQDVKGMKGKGSTLYIG